MLLVLPDRRTCSTAPLALASTAPALLTLALLPLAAAAPAAALLAAAMLAAATLAAATLAAATLAYSSPQCSICLLPKIYLLLRPKELSPGMISLYLLLI